MYLKKISVINFKSFKQLELDFDSKINCFVGDNGQGKTNLLDAIYYLSMCKSAFNPNDNQVVNHGESFFVIQGKYERNLSDENIYCGFKQSEGKVFRRNGKDYERLADHIGLLPVVMVSPADSALIEESGEERRKYMNSVISQFDKIYLDEVMRYNRVLAQRNSFLKNYRGMDFSYDILEAIDEQLVQYGKIIHAKRQAFIGQLIPIFQEYYSRVSGGAEVVSLSYRSHLNSNDLQELLKANIEKDRALQYTSSGVHRDDIVLNIDGYPIRREGSQGQQKTYLIALKLAQFDFLSRVSEIKPILLLDDIFDKLDFKRVEQLVRLVALDGFGQIFITDTNKNRIDEILARINSGYRLFHVDLAEVNLLLER
ncbi:DNA replication and repair protein RecF [Tenuifilaceae bacterium CYCD]|nr:DNA replication and repair protein RecF [Tenuifilaceae bacterium CYCD]